MDQKAGSGGPPNDVGVTTEIAGAARHVRHVLVRTVQWHTELDPSHELHGSSWFIMMSPWILVLYTLGYHFPRVPSQAIVYMQSLLVDSFLLMKRLPQSLAVGIRFIRFFVQI